MCTGCARPCGPGCHPEGTVTLFTYDSHNRVTSMQRATGTSGSCDWAVGWQWVGVSGLVMWVSC
ncbi:RHS repeat domain-containing protein [Streptomyces althioticus]